jgi:hypothetical protein
MNTGAHSSESPRVSRLRGELWIGPACGFVGAVIVNIVWRRLDLPYRLEFVLALYLFIATSVTAYVNGGWRAHPWRVVLLVILFPAVGVMFGHFAS